MSAIDHELRRENLGSTVSRQLISALNAELAATYPEEGATHFRLEAEEVEPGRGAFLVIFVGGQPVGYGAIRRLDERTAEIKRMYVEPVARGRGIGRNMLDALEAEAGRLGVTRIVLETGERQTAAVNLYESAGFTRIPRFGEYENSPLSVCMAKRL
jgi:putative acetyltransferase